MGFGDFCGKNGSLVVKLTVVPSSTEESLISHCSHGVNLLVLLDFNKMRTFFNVFFYWGLLDGAAILCPNLLIISGFCFSG